MMSCCQHSIATTSLSDVACTALTYSSLVSSLKKLPILPTSQNILESNVWKLIDALEYYFCIIDATNLNKIKRLVREQEYNRALWSLTEHLDPFVEEFEDLVKMLSISWGRLRWHLSRERRWAERMYQLDCAYQGLSANGDRSRITYFTKMIESCDNGQRMMLKFQNRVNKAQQKETNKPSPTMRIIARERKSP